MNEQQPYEKHFTEKMRQLPVPDANRTWQQMHALLDKEMPPGSSGGIGGSGTRWWMISVGAGIIFAGTWFSGRQFIAGSRHKHTVASTRAATDSATAIDPSTVNDSLSLTKNNFQKIIHGDTSTLIIKQFPAVIPGENDERNNKALRPSAHDVAGMPNGLSNTTDNNSLPSVPESKKGDAKKNSSHPGKRRAHQSADEMAKNSTGHRSHAGDHANSEVKQKSRPDGTARNARLNGNDETAGNSQPHQSLPGRRNRRSDKEVAKNNKTRQQPAGKGENDKIRQKDDHNDTVTQVGKETAQEAGSKPDEEVVKASPVSVNTGYQDLYATSPYIVFDEVMDNDYVTTSLPSRTERINFPSHHTRSRSAASGNERVFAVGVTLPVGLPLGNQKTVGYNVNAMPNTITDYLPMPHFQYHFNSRLYAQAELQMLSPQYIPEVCVSQRYAIGGPNPIFVSYFAKKLYYFSVPLSIHYSPVRNVYVGTGLQYSRFISGVAGITESYFSPGGPITFNKDYVRFTNTYRSSSIKSDELRVLLEVNYYKNRFTIGMRYNQALGNYVVQHIPGTQDYTNDKNKAFQFYIRYNLFETLRRPKQSIAGRLLTFK